MVSFLHSFYFTLFSSQFIESLDEMKINKHDQQLTVVSNKFIYNKNHYLAPLLLPLLHFFQFMPTSNLYLLLTSFPRFTTINMFCLVDLKTSMAAFFSSSCLTSKLAKSRITVIELLKQKQQHF